MQSLIILCHILLCFALIGLVLLQQGKGASAGAGFGAGASSTLFGSRGPASFLMKLTGGLAIGFFITSLWLGHEAASSSKAMNQLLIAPSTTQQIPLSPLDSNTTNPTSGGKSSV